MERGVVMNTKESKFHFDRDHFEEPLRYGGVLLYQIGDWQCQPGRVIGIHKQICHEISCVVSGTGTFFCNGVAYRARPGDLFISPYASLHDIFSSRHDPLRYNYCGFMLDAAASAEYARLDDFFSGIKEPMDVDRHSSVRHIFSLLFNELITDDGSTGLLMKNELNLLLLLTRRCYEKGDVPQREQPQSDSFRQRMVYDVVNYIDNNIFGIKKLTDISGRLGYSYSYVSQTFAAVMGISLGSYYQQRRFEKAVELLSGSNTVTQVSEALGFDSVQSFSRFFRRNCGTPPSKYVQAGSQPPPQL